MDDLDYADATYLRHKLHIFWLNGETYESVKSFWDTLLSSNPKTSSVLSTLFSCNPKTPRFPSLRGRAYKKMEDRGWLNVANLDNAADKFPASARQIFHKLRSKAIQYWDRRRPPGIQMVLKPYDIDSDTDVISSSKRAVPACIPYVVLKKNSNPIAGDVNDISSREIDWLTRHTRAWMAWKVYLPDAGFKQPVEQWRNYERDQTRQLSAQGTSDSDSDTEQGSAKRLLPESIASDARQNVETICSMSK